MAAENNNAEEVFHRAIEIADGAARAAYLDQACAEDETLRKEVEALLQGEFTW
jgi:hypothetical protein